MSDQNQQKLVAALRRLERIKKQEAFDPINLNSQPTAKQKEVITDFGKWKQYWIRAGNQSGKSQTCARLLTWVLTNTHPTWKYPDTWGEEPLLAIVCGRTGKQIEDSLLPKIRSYLEPGSYKEVRIGNIIQRLELTNGNRIVFQSLENPNIARERLMSYVAHITWCDELPPTLGLVRELLVRTQARNGYALWSFTPTVVATDIQKFVDNISEPEGKVYRFGMLDNPLYSDSVRRQELLDRYSHLPEDQRNAIFNGDWISGDDQVYYFHYDKMVSMPEHYSPFWRHVESIDPALKSAAGLTVWAEEPVSGRWYCVLAEYLKGILVPSDLVEAVRQKTSRFNIVRRISDPHEVWYIQTAQKMGLTYMGVHKKNERKAELIKQLQQKLGREVMLTPVVNDLIDELQNCRWSSQTEGKIINASSFHLLDSAQYFVDNIPRPEKNAFIGSWQEQLRSAHTARKVAEEKAQKKQEQVRIIKRGVSPWKHKRQLS